MQFKIVSVGCHIGSMLLFVKGVELNPSKKAKLNKESKKEKDQEYDKNRKREFQLSWTVGRPWLEFTKEDCKMRCTS